MGNRRNNSKKDKGARANPSAKPSDSPVTAPPAGGGAAAPVASFPLSSKRSEKGMKVQKSASAKAAIEDQPAGAKVDHLQQSDLSKASSAPADAPTAAEATPAPHALPTTTDTATSSSTTSITSQDSSPTDADSTSAVISTIITAIDATSGDNNQAVLEEQLSNAVKPAAAAAAAAGPSKLAVPQPGPAAGAVAGGDKLPEGAAAPLPPAANPQTSSDSLADTGRDNTKSSSDKTATADAASDSPIPTAAGAAGDRAGMSSPPATSLDITPGPEPAAAPPADTSVELSHGQAPAAAAADSSKAADLTTADTDTSSGPDGSTTTQHYGISDKAGSSTPTGTDHATTGTQAGSGAGSSATGTPDSDVNATLTTSTSSSSRAIDNFSQGAAEGPAGGSVITTLGNAFKPPTGGLPAAANVSGDSNDSSLGQPPATTGTSREAQGGPTVAPMMSPADRHDDSSRAVDRAAGSGEAGSGSIRETAPLPMAQPDSNLQTSSTSHTHIYTRDTSSSSSRAMEGVQPSEQPAVTAGQPGPSGVDKESDLAAESSSSSRGISSSSTKPSSDQPQQPEARASSAAAEGKDTDTTAQLQPLSEAPQAREAPKAPQVDISTDSKTPEGSSSSITTTAPTTTSDLAPAAASELQAPQPTPAPPAPPPYDAEVSEEAAATIAAIAAAASGVKPFPPELLPAVGTSPDLTSKHLEVLSVWYTKLCFDTEAQQQAALKQHCDPHMEFEDNFIKVSGQSLVGVQFYALKRVLRGIELLPEKIEVLPDGPAAPTTYRLRIISRIAFKFWNYKWFPLLTLVFPALLLLPQRIESWATDELTVRTEDNRIMAYKQRVHNIPTAPSAVRWVLGLASSWTLMYTLGW